MRPTETITMAKILTSEEQPDHHDKDGKDILGLIGFTHDGVFVHDPWVSPCSRFNVDPYEEYHEWDMDRFIDMTCDAHFIEMNSGADCRRIAAGVIEEILEQAGEDSWEGAADILDHALEGADSRDLDDTQVVRSVVLEIVSRHDPR